MTTDWEWDGKDLPYRPNPDFDPTATHRLHRTAAEDLDPVVFEILRSKFWNINEEHADTIQRVSGSPVVVEAYDFNTSICTESGDPFLFAPYLQSFAAAAEYTVKYTLENRIVHGIHDGDIFLLNDCLVAGNHQMDIGVYMPVFVGEEIFCWVYNLCHSRDIGGSEPGGFCVSALDRYAESPTMRAIKIADREGVREDVEDTFLGHSRTPHLLALELRSQLAGVERARRRILELCEHYGADISKAVMYKLIDDTERSVREKLSSLPDGRWSETIHVGGAFAGDTDLHRTVLTLEKRGDTLTFSNRGTDPQVGSINSNFGQWRAAISCSVASLLAAEHWFCLGGVVRCLDFDAEVGTITCADRDGAYSTLYGQLVTIFTAERLLGRMVFPDPELRRGVIATSGLSSAGFMTHWGPDQWTGAMTASVTLDHIAGGTGAFSFRDGIDQGGTTVWPKSECPDVESWEKFFPVLYLYRRACRGGGHGKFRGGDGIGMAFTGHGPEDQHWSAIAMTASTSTQAGIFGGHWGVTSYFYGVQDSDLQARFSDGRAPASLPELRELDGGARVPAKSMGIRLSHDDIGACECFGGGGYGDPLRRDPERVAADVAEKAITAAVAESIYGIRLDDSGAVDRAATESLRNSALAARLRRAVGPEQTTVGSEHGDATGVAVAEELRVVEIDGAAVTVCASCGHGLCAVESNYKSHSARIDGSLTEIDPNLYVDPADEGLARFGVVFSAQSAGCSSRTSSCRETSPRVGIWHRMPPLY